MSLALRDDDSDAGTPGQTLLEPPNLTDSIALHDFNASLLAAFTSGAHWRYQLMGTESYNRELNVDPFFPTFYQFNRAAFAGQSTYSIHGFGVTAGYEYEVENGFISFIGLHARRNNQAGFLDARWQPIARLTVNAGARAEDNANFGTRVVPRVGAAYALRIARGAFGDTRLRVSYGEGIVEPRFDQTFGTDPCDPGNPNLRPEQSRTVHAGVEQKLASDRVRVTVDYFDDQFRDIVSFGYVFNAAARMPLCRNSTVSERAHSSIPIWRVRAAGALHRKRGSLAGSPLREITPTIPLECSPRRTQPIRRRFRAIACSGVQ